MPLFYRFDDNNNSNKKANNLYITICELLVLIIKFKLWTIQREGEERKGEKRNNQMCDLCYLWAITILFLCTLRVLLPFCWLLYAPNQIMFWQILFLPHIYLFVYSGFLFAVWADCDAESKRGRAKYFGLCDSLDSDDERHLFILLPQLFDSLSRSDFKWHIICVAVHNSVNLDEPFI